MPPIRFSGFIFKLLKIQERCNKTYLKCSLVEICSKSLFLLFVGCIYCFLLQQHVRFRVYRTDLKFNPARIDITALGFLFASNTIVKRELEFWDKILPKSYLTSMKQRHFHKCGSRKNCKGHTSVVTLMIPLPLELFLVLISWGKHRNNY